MKYNRALDHLVLSAMAFRKGRAELAASHFSKAMGSSDVVAAIQILEANNSRAFKALQAAKRRMRASEEDDLEDEGDLELGADLVEDEDSLEDQLPQEELAGDLDELEDPEEDEGNVNAAFASVLKSMRPGARRRR